MGREPRAQKKVGGTKHTLVIIICAHTRYVSDKGTKCQSLHIFLPPSHCSSSSIKHMPFVVTNYTYVNN